MTNFTLNKDRYVQFYAPTPPTSFRIMRDGTTIYEGRVYPTPGSLYGTINLTKIVENYVYNHLPDNFGISKTIRAILSDAYVSFEVDYLTSGGTWEKVDDFGALAWYDYDESPSSYSSLSLADVVNGHSTAGVNYTKTTLSNGRVGNLITTAATNDYDESYCGRYGITYLNKRGGYDFFLFEGKCSKSEDYEIYKYNKTYDNNYNGFGSTRYQNVTTTKYTLNTGWLSEEESYRFAKHVVGSNQVWLQDLETGKTRPVVITNTSTDYKEHNGKTPINYTLTVINSQEEVRK